MPRLILLIAVIAIALIIWHKIKSARGQQRKKIIFWSIFSGVAAILALLAVTGHLNVITAAIAGLVALLPRAMSLAKYLPFIQRLYQQGNQTAQQTQPPPASKDQAMSREEALEVLGLQPGFTREELIKAHRRMMQKVHPDRGGSDYLAAQINRAKDTLLS